MATTEVPPPAPSRPDRGQPLTTTLLLTLVAALAWALSQARQREADLQRRIENLAAGYRGQSEARRQLFLARQTIARLRAGLDAPLTPAETAR